jgi:hypothetical protein
MKLLQPETDEFYAYSEYGVNKKFFWILVILAIIGLISLGSVITYQLIDAKSFPLLENKIFKITIEHRIENETLNNLKSYVETSVNDLIYERREE